MRYIRITFAVVVSSVLFLGFGCGEEDKPPTGGDTDTVVDSGFVYEPDNPPSNLADGYFGTLEVHRDFQGFPVIRIDTVLLTLTIGTTIGYALTYETHSTSFCDMEGELKFGKGGLTVFETKTTSGGSCDSLRVPFGPFNSVFTDSSLSMDTVRQITLLNGTKEDVDYRFELKAYNRFQFYLGTSETEVFYTGSVDTLLDTISLQITDTFFVADYADASSDQCDVSGRIELDLSGHSVRFSVDSIEADTTVCTSWLNLHGAFLAQFHHDRLELSATRQAPATGTAADSARFKIVLYGM